MNQTPSAVLEALQSGCTPRAIEKALAAGALGTLAADCRLPWGPELRSLVRRLVRRWGIEPPNVG